MSKLKKMLVVAVAGIMMALAVGCGGGGGGGSSDAKSSSAPAASNGKRIGVAMPTQSSQRWKLSVTPLTCSTPKTMCRLRFPRLKT